MARQETMSLLSQIERQLDTIDDNNDEVRGKVSPSFQKAKEAFATYSSFVDQMLLKATEVKVTGDAMFDAANSSIDGFVALSNAAYEVMYAEVEKRASQQAMTRNLTVLTVALTIGLALALSWLITRALAGPMSRAISVFGAISSGQYNNQINTSGVDEVAQVLRALDDMQGKLRAQIEAERAQAEENARVRAALDNVSSNVMVADPNFKTSIPTRPFARC
jgi:methyl-accepting chemotaxis protein